jgi:hypothetical protein
MSEKIFATFDSDEATTAALNTLYEHLDDDDVEVITPAHARDDAGAPVIPVLGARQGAANIQSGEAAAAGMEPGGDLQVNLSKHGIPDAALPFYQEVLQDGGSVIVVEADDPDRIKQMLTQAGATNVS